MILSNYSYIYDVFNRAVNTIKAPKLQAQDIHTYDIKLIGSRLSAKTIQMLKFLIEAGYAAKEKNINIATTIVRYEVAGATETYEELIGVLEDIYDIPANRSNSNSTKRTLNIGNNTIKAIGIISNRKKKTPKLGLARKGIKKDIQINFFEEVTEIEKEKTISVVKQATGGAKIIINIYIANPWVLSMWYVKKFNRELPFKEKVLRKDGEQFKAVYIKSKKKYRINHITNHRVNTYLSEAQHQELYDLWDIDETLARVADLGMPGVAEGLIYAPILHKVLPPSNKVPTQEFRAGLDWGTSTGANGSATALVIGRITKNYQTLQIEKEYYHSNAHQYYKNDTELIKDVVDTLIQFYKDNKEQIKRAGDTIVVYFDYAAHALEGLLTTELRSRPERLITQKIDIQPCYKFDVPVRVDIVKALISQGRYKASRELTPYHYEELEGSMYDDTKKVKGRPTRLNEDDHTLDAMEYLIGSDLYNFADTRYLAHNKLV